MKCIKVCDVIHTIFYVILTSDDHDVMVGRRRSKTPLDSKQFYCRTDCLFHNKNCRTVMPVTPDNVRCPADFAGTDG